jgi:multidrug resistance efflux pump
MTMNDDLHASQITWRRVRRFVFLTVSSIAIGTTVLYLLLGGTVLLNADGLVTRCRVAVASPWPDARVRQIVVRPGDWVLAGQKIAIVESAAMSRLLADLAAEKARLTSRLAQLSARSAVVKALLPSASANAAQTTAFLVTLQKARTRGIVVDRTIQTMTAAKLDAMDKLLTLREEVTSLETEISSNQEALIEVAAAYADSQKAYGSGLLTAPATGFIGSKVALVGEVLIAGNADVANIYTGPSYVVAYIPENYMFDVQEGQKLMVSGRGHAVAGRIDKVLPVTEALPPEFQLPNRARGRGQLARVSLLETEHYAVDEKVQLTSCFLGGCRIRMHDLIKVAAPGLARSAPKLVTANDGTTTVTLAATDASPSSLTDQDTSACPYQTPATAAISSSSAQK